uniref:BRMS1 like transcriptional repressor b n=1 Tax=Nothobranchius furzeri TaxID=105023 RepID=A0A8C6VQE8_NOTFU
MPVHSREKKDSNHEEMEVDFPEQDGSSTDEEDTVSSSVSEDGDSSEMDDEDCERRRMEFIVSDILPHQLVLDDLDILEDWTAIRKAMASLGPHRVKVDVAAVKPDRHHHVARSEDGRLFYDNQWYCRGQTICINRKEECPTSAIITAINNDEVWFKRLDGTKSKLYVSQLQKGKYVIKHA